MKKIFLSTSLVLWSASVSAVTLEEALTSGYNHNDELKIIRTDFLTEIEQFPQAVSEFMPKVNATVESSENKARAVNRSQSGDFRRDNRTFSKFITVEQPLFNGGGSVAKLKAAQSSFRASRGNYYKREQEIFLGQIDTYLGCVEVKEKYNISKISVKSNKTQLEAMKEKFKLGESTETEVASAEAGLAAAEANQAVAYANFESSKANFIRVLGVEAINIRMPVTPSDIPQNLEDLTNHAITANPSVQAARHTTKAAKAGEYAAKARLLPRVSFRLQHGRTDYDRQDRTISNIDNRSTTSTLSMTVPILAEGGAEYSRVRQAKFQTRKSASQLDNEIKRVTAESRANWEAFAAAKLRIAATKKAVKAAEVAYEGMVQEEMLGSKTIVDVLNTEERLQKARESNVEAKKGLILAAYRIKSLTGNLTAKSMKLPVEYFNPEKEFKRVKIKIVGF